MAETKADRPASAEALDARLYDQSGVGWEGELAFYRGLAAEAAEDGVLELACGTGRVLFDLAATGTRLTGIDLSQESIEVARRKAAGHANVTLLVGDMRDFDLPHRFGLAIVPGHSFQFMTTADDQLAALACIHRHLKPGGRLAVHLDHAEIDWLGGLPLSNGVREESQQVIEDPATGARYRSHWSWTYDRASESATIALGWDELATDGSVVGTLELPPRALHVIARVEMEHALRRAGFELEGLFGGFDRSPFQHDSESQIWLARRPLLDPRSAQR